MDEISRCRDCPRRTVAPWEYRRDPAGWRARGYRRRGANGLCEACNQREKRRAARPGTGWGGLHATIGAPPGWQDDALCAQTDPEAFFPEKGGSTREAKRICLRCDVQDACLEYALAHQERFGIWGGFSERERRPLLAARKATELREAS